MFFAKGLDFTKIAVCRRENELESLKTVVSETQNSESRPQFALVQGETGSGKGVLCEKVEEKCKKDGVLCLRGVFEEGSANTKPFSAIMDSIRTAYLDLTSGSTPEAREWKKTIDKGLGVHKTVLATLIPEIGENDPGVLIEAVDRVVDASNFKRLIAAVKAFLRTLCTKQPVLWVLEDVQFATVCAVILIQTTLGDNRFSRFGFIGTHHLSLKNEGGMLSCDKTGHLECKDLDDSTMAGFRDSLPSAQLTEVVLHPLGEACITHMLEQLLGLKEESDYSKWLPLATVIKRRTGGNYFFVKHAIALLEKEKLIYFNTVTFRWQFDLEGVKKVLNTTANVIDIVAEKIHHMSKDQQKALVHASSFGTMNFDLDTLFSTFGGKEFDSIGQLDAALMKCVDEELLEAMDGGKEFIFNHPRILESAYSLISEEDRPKFHLEIGRNLLAMAASLPREGCNSRIEDKWKLHAVRQLDLGADVLPIDEKAWLAELNYEVARVAVCSGSFFPAMDFLSAGLDMLDRNSHQAWEKHYDTVLGLVTLMARMKFSVGMLDESSELFDCIIANAGNYHDKLPAYYMKVLALTQTGFLHDAFDLVLKVLSELEVNFPKKQNKVALKMNMTKVQRELCRLADEDLAKTTIDEAGPLYDAIDFVVYLKELSSLIGRSDYYKLTQIWMAQTALDAGPAVLTRISFASWAMCFVRSGDLQQAERFGNLSVEIGKLHGSSNAHDVRATIMYVCYCRHWKHSYQECCDLLVKQNELVIEKGFTEVLSLGILAYGSMYFCSGMRLGPLEADLRRGYDTLNDYGYETDRDRLAPILQLVQNLQGKSKNVLVLTGDILDQEAFFEQHSTVSKTSGRADEEILQTFFLARLYLAYLFGNLDVAMEMIQRLENIKMMTTPSVWFIYQMFYQGMSVFALARKTKSVITKSRSIRAGAKCIKIFDGWVCHGAVNCCHMQLLLAAEHLAVSPNNSVEKVQKAYDKAIAAAARLGFLQDRALGNERAGLFFLEKNDKHWAGIYLREAHQLFTDWGATAKAQQVQQVLGVGLVATPEGTSSSFVKAKPRMVSMMEKMVDTTEDSQRSYNSIDSPRVQKMPSALSHTPKGVSSRGEMLLNVRSS